MLNDVSRAGRDVPATGAQPAWLEVGEKCGLAKAGGGWQIDRRATTKEQHPETANPEADRDHGAGPANGNCCEQFRQIWRCECQLPTNIEGISEALHDIALPRTDSSCNWV